MQMTEFEIVRSYREAANQKAQIKILAELNLCKIGEIKRILLAAGENVYDKRMQKDAPVEIKEEEEMGNVVEQEIPEVVLDVIFRRIDELEKIIKEANKEYKALSQFMEGRSNE